MPWLAPFLTSPPKGESFKINIICLPGLLEKGTRDSKFCCRWDGSLLQAGGICPMAGCESHLAQADGSQKTWLQRVTLLVIKTFLPTSRSLLRLWSSCFLFPQPQPPALFLFPCHANQLSLALTALPACLSCRVQPHYFCPLCHVFSCHLCPLLSLFLRSFIMVSAGNAYPIDFNGQ